MAAHTVSISIVRFTPDDLTLISIGCQHDSQIITWDWRSGNDLGVGKLMSPVNAIAVSFDSSMCVTVGSKSVKYWFLPMASDGLNKRTGLTSRSAILADKRNVNFVDATFCDQTNRMLAVTASGEYVKCYSWKDSGDFKAICLARIPEGLLVGCSDGLVRLFCLIGDDLDFLADLAPPTHLFMDPANAYDPQQLQNHPEDAIFPEPRCLVASSSSPTFVVGYADRSLIEFSREHNSWSFRRASLGHTGAVNCIESFPSSSSCMPAGTVITGGSDGTVRFWNFGGDSDDKGDIANILCPSLLKVVYLDENPDLLLDKRCIELVGPSQDDPNASTTMTPSGVQCTRVSHDGRSMVAGTANGMLYLIDLSFSDTPIIDVINAHDSEVSSLDFSDHAST
uniref:WD repeat-containing protein 55 homolog n=1 Tax=Caenorhabditis japonica TaxID=281687 RepID=A0A8R1I8I9_CAEJA